MQKTITRAIAPVPGVDSRLNERLIADLNQSLANLTDLAVAYKQAHWNVVGIDFAQLHELFDELHDQARGFIDEVAERAVALGGVADGTIQAAVENTTLAPFPRDERGERLLLEALTQRIDRLNADMRKAMEASADEPATQDVYVEILRGIEKQRWMLQAHLAS
jgi:starvation-inducible DNA-binding protein